MIAPPRVPVTAARARQLPTQTTPEPSTTTQRRSSHRLARRSIGAAVALLCLLQVLALDERNPVTRTLSSYEYTRWGWLFPAALLVFGAGIAVLAAGLPKDLRTARLLLSGAAAASVTTAAFPSGDALTGYYWPGEVHRWGSIALMVFVLGAALSLLRAGVLATAGPATVRLIAVGSVAGMAFLAGQSMKPAVPQLIGMAPLAGGLAQRVLVAAVAAVLLLIGGQLSQRGPAGHVTGRPTPAGRMPGGRAG